LGLLSLCKEMKSLEEVDQFAIEIRACEKKSSEEALER
jgi:hypothetical protein